MSDAISKLRNALVVGNAQKEDAMLSAIEEIIRLMKEVKQYQDKASFRVPTKGPALVKRYQVWECKIVVPDDAELPDGFDWPPRRAAMETSNEVQSELAGDYADNSSTEQLRWFIDYEPELERVNKHRGTNWTQEMLNEILYEAIAIRERHDANAAYTAAVNLYAEAKDVYYAARDTYYESRNALNTALRAYNESKETWSLEPT